MILSVGGGLGYRTLGYPDSDEEYPRPGRQGRQGWGRGGEARPCASLWTTKFMIAKTSYQKLNDNLQNMRLYVFHYQDKPLEV